MKIVNRELAGPDDPIYKGGLVVSNVNIPPPAASQGAPASDRKDNAGMQPAEVFSVEYYDDTWESGCYFTCINRDYIFAIRPDDPEPRWECINLNYARWDAVTSAFTATSGLILSAGNSCRDPCRPALRKSSGGTQSRRHRSRLNLYALRNTLISSNTFVAAMGKALPPCTLFSLKIPMSHH